MKKISSLVLVVLIINSGCASDVSVENSTSNQVFHFDYESWKANQIKKFQNLKGVKVEKSVVGNNTPFQSITFDLENFRWKDEFRIFDEASINKQSLQGLYDKEEKENSITFRAKRKAMKVQTYTIFYDENHNVETIEILMNKENLLFESKYYLRFECMKGYSIQNYQILKILNKKSFYNIEGKFIFAK